jgi:thiamine pyrophosphate-dependent acetolactate synthase large subunit-like protein
MGMQVDDMQELGLAVEKSLAAGRPCVINVPIAHAGPADDSR